MASSTTKSDTPASSAAATAADASKAPAGEQKEEKKARKGGKAAATGERKSRPRKAKDGAVNKDSIEAIGEREKKNIKKLGRSFTTFFEGKPVGEYNTFAQTLVSVGEIFNGKRKIKRKAKAEDGSDAPAKTKKMTGYLLYSAEIRPSVKAANKDMAPKDTMSEIASRWRAKTDEEKARYNERAKKMNEEAGVPSAASKEERSAKKSTTKGGGRKKAAADA